MVKGVLKVHNCIKCNVTNCEYHDKANHCCASEIEVGPHYANTSSDTICATFKANKSE
ncbi:MAG: DUF1540 domain-containing protein [Clostridia bacterium]|nr:DUF1540 domain-containing protein [Clostridia bacterium]